MKQTPPNRKLLSLIENALLKEMTIPIYATHIASALFWSGLDVAKQKEMRDILQILKEDSIGHICQLNEVKQRHLDSRA